MIDLRKAAIAFHFVKLGDVVIDAGAFIGSYSFLYTKMIGPKGLVFAYEPQPVAVEEFKNRVCRKGIENVIIRQKAVSSVNGKKIGMNIYLEKLDQSCTVEPLLMNEERMPGDTTLIEVETECLDSMMDQIGERKISFIKIDTEGHESEVIKGAGKLIERHQPLIAFEYGYIPKKFEPTTIAQLQILNYTCFDLKTMNQVEPQYISLLPTDLIAVPQHQLENFILFSSRLSKYRFLLKLFVGYAFLKACIRKIG